MLKIAFRVRQTLILSIFGLKIKKTKNVPILEGSSPRRHHYAKVSNYNRGPQRRCLFTVARPGVLPRQSTTVLPSLNQNIEYFDVFQVLY